MHHYDQAVNHRNHDNYHNNNNNDDDNGDNDDDDGDGDDSSYCCKWHLEIIWSQRIKAEVEAEGEGELVKTFPGLVGNHYNFPWIKSHQPTDNDDDKRYSFATAKNFTLSDFPNKTRKSL